MRKEEKSIPFYDSFINTMFFLPEDTTKRHPVVCKVHGIVTDSFEREELLAKIFTENNIGYFVFHFTGFYTSPGETSIQRSLENLDHIVSYLINHSNVHPLKIGLYGVSLGAAIAICHASRDPRVACLALQAPLFDFSFVVNYPEFDALWEGLSATGLVRLPEKGVKQKLLCDIRGNNPLKCIQKIAPRPVLIVAGSKDNFIPIQGILDLFSMAIDPKDFKIIEDADHNLTNFNAKLKTFDVIREFFVKKMNFL